MGITLNSNVLDPMKHSAVVFKDNVGSNVIDSLEVGDPANPKSKGSNEKMCGSVGKVITVRKERVLNKIVKDHG